MGKWIVPLLFFCMMCASVLVTMMLVHWQIGDGRLKVYDDETRLNAKEVESKGEKYDPTIIYTSSFRLRKTYSQQGWIGWNVQVDTVSNSVTRKGK